MILKENFLYSERGKDGNTSISSQDDIRNQFIQQAKILANLLQSIDNAGIFSNQVLIFLDNHIKYSQEK